MRIPSGSTDRYLYFVAVDATDLKTRQTGLSSFTVRRSRNGAASAAFTTPTINETDSSNMPGVYELLMDEDTTLDAGKDEQEMVVHITHAGMAPVTRAVEIYRPKGTEGLTVTIESDGMVHADVKEIEGSDATNQIRDAVVDDATRIDASALNTLSGHDPGETIMGATDLGTGAGLTSLASASALTSLAGIFAGITSLAEWLGLIAGKQAGDSTARTEIRATGAGSGTFDETTDSQEALRDRGDAAWTTATGFSTHSAADVWAVGSRTLTSISGLGIALASKLTAYVQLLARKDAAIATDNATEMGEINADGGSGAGAYANTTDALEAIRDNQQTAAGAALTAYDPPTRAEATDDKDEILTRLGSPAGTSVSDDIADIEGKVDDLESRLGTPSDLGSGATVAANLADIEAQTDDIGAAGAGLTALASASALTTLDGKVDAVEAVTAKLDDLIEDASGYRFTEKALEEGPSGEGGGSGDWSADEKTVIRAVLGIPGSGTTPADPSTGILDTIRDAVVGVDTKLGTPAGASVSADVASVQSDTTAIKTETDKLADTLEDQGGGTYGFTEAALQEAPSGGGGGATAEEIADEVQTRTIAGVTTVGTVTALANNSVTAAALAADAVTEIQSGLATSAELAKVPKSDSNVTWNATAAAQLQQEAADALAAYDPPTKAELDAAVAPLALEATAQSVKGKTDALPSDPADQSALDAAIDAAEAAILAAIPSAASNAAALIDLADGVETGLTPRQALRLMTAALAGKLTGAATTTIVIRNAVADSKDRITATVDEDGNRAAVSVDLS